jgi:hypothetical protein
VAAVTVALVAWIVSVAYTAAQSNPGLRPDFPVTALARASSVAAPAVRPYADEPPNAPPLDRVPPNLTVSKSLRPIVQLMLERSAIFRRQCLRIANAGHLTVTITGAVAFETQHARARTLFVRRDGTLRADVQIGPLDDQVELIAHEIEHVIEQLDGVDLSRQASLRGTAASKCEDGSFETIRAVRAGLAATREVNPVR